MQAPPGFTLEKRIAVGGTAEIWSAHHPERGAVVLKRAIGSVALLEREREALEKIRSPHVIRMLAAGEGYLVLERVDGLDLAALANHLRRRGESLPLGAALSLLDGIGLGLDAIHRAGWVHADLSPSNVLLGRDGSVRIIDLGLVRRIGAPAPSIAEGTPAYQSLEQLRLQPIDARADLFALGLIAYELITGVHARPSGMLGAIELLEARMKKPAPPSMVRPGIPPVIDRQILRLLEPDPELRPASAARWIEEIAEARDPLALRRAVERVSGMSIPVAATESQPKKAKAQTLGPESVDDTVLLLASRPKRSLWTIAPIAAALAMIAMIALVVLMRPPPEETHASPDAAPSIETVTPIVTQQIEMAAPIQASIDAGVRIEKKRWPARKPHLVVSGSVWISGGGMDGQAPKTSGPLEEGPTLIQLVSGDMRVLLRVERNRETIKVTIGAPPSSWYQVECSGGTEGPTPLIGIPLDGELRCEAARSDGARAMFSLARVML